MDANFPLNFGRPISEEPQLAALLPEAVQQLARDFETAGIQQQLSTQHLPDIFAFRNAVEAELLRPQTAALLPQLLYRVDVPEKYSSAALAAGTAPQQALAELLVIRALQKVWLRKNYR
ncbi:MAG: hypothetical protein ACRC3B_02365 [Bacteroidia bacterium]